MTVTSVLKSCLLILTFGSSLFTVLSMFPFSHFFTCLDLVILGSILDIVRNSLCLDSVMFLDDNGAADCKTDSEGSFAV